ncbi:DUF3857 domain-containing protein [candidate division KSB1 bacterium]|nr:DUF3857 domain-containing protein [candidate division KSB1 bacterium]
MKRFLILYTLVCLLPAILISAQIKESEQDAIFLKMEKTYTLNQDGSWRFDYAHHVKLLTYRSVTRGLGETFIVFNPEYQTLVVDKSITTMADGKQVPSPPNAFNDVLPRAVNDAPDYGYLIERVVSHTGLERNCTIDLRYHIENKAEFIPWFWGEELFAHRYPIAELRVVVQVPEGVNLTYELLNSNATPTVSRENGVQRFTWICENLPALQMEDRHPSFDDFAPRLLFSTCPSWETLREYIKKEIATKLNLDQDIQASLVKECDAVDPLKKALQIRTKMAGEINDISPDPSWLGFRFENLARVVARNYAQEIEKSALLSALLRNLDIPAEMVLLATTRTFAANVPTLIQFDKAVVAVSLPARQTYYVPVTGEAVRSLTDEFPDHTVFHLQREGEPVTKLSQTADDHIHMVADLKLNGTEEIQGAVQLSAGGYFLPYFQLLDNEGQTEFAGKLVKKILPPGKIADVTVLKLDRDQIMLTATYQSEKFLKKMDYPDWHVCPGINSVADEWHYTPYLQTRFSPVSLPAKLNEEIDLMITAPDSLVWDFPESSGSERDAEGSVQQSLQTKTGHFTLKVLTQKNRIHYNRHTEINTRVIAVEQYDALRRLLTGLHDQNRRVFYLSGKE